MPGHTPDEKAKPKPVVKAPKKKKKKGK